MSNQVVSTIALIVAGVIMAELPWVEKKFLIPITEQHPHLAVLSEGIVGALMVWWAGRRQAKEDEWKPKR